MASTHSTTASPLTYAVTNAMRRLYPESLADKSFDNTGLLLEAPHNPAAGMQNKVLLTIDLTRAVAREAIEKKCGVIVAYHPIIFRGLKSLTLEDTQQTSLLELASKGISVYCPHTAVDAAQGGNADWLADIVTAERTKPWDPEIGMNSSTVDESSDTSIHVFPPQVNVGDYELAAIPHTRRPLTPNPSYSNAGMGRIVKFSPAVRIGNRHSPSTNTADVPSLWDILQTIRGYLGGPAAISVAMPQSLDLSLNEENLYMARPIRGVGVCAGSGSLLNTLVTSEEGDDVDLLLTGELSHHEALAATENGKVVVCLGHSNSERGYLGAVMRWQLLAELKREEFGKEGGEVQVLVSQTDRDPFLVMGRA